MKQWKSYKPISAKHINVITNVHIVKVIYRCQLKCIDDKFKQS